MHRPAAGRRADRDAAQRRKVTERPDAEVSAPVRKRGTGARGFLSYAPGARAPAGASSARSRGFRSRTGVFARVPGVFARVPGSFCGTPTRFVRHAAFPPRQRERPDPVGSGLSGKAPGDDLLLHGLSHTTIGAAAFHFRVRDGIGWFHSAMVARERGEGRRRPYVSGMGPRRPLISWEVANIEAIPASTCCRG